LEEWALCILQPEKDQEFQMKELYDNDAEKTQHWDRVVKGKKPAPFNITTKIFLLVKTTLRVTQKTAISTDLILTQTDMKDSPTKN
jgi:hypothetical protein